MVKVVKCKYIDIHTARADLGCTTTFPLEYVLGVTEKEAKERITAHLLDSDAFCWIESSYRNL